MSYSINSILLIYLLAINLIGICIMGYDKLAAVKNLWRIPEKNLFLIAIIGGSIGCLLGMYTFRHKTLHTQFVIGMPVILIIQIALYIWLKFFTRYSFVIM